MNTVIKPDSIYVWNANSIMRKIGEQSVDYFFDNDVITVRETFLNLPEPYCQPYKVAVHFANDLLFSMYELGRMHGIKQERESRKRKAKRTVTYRNTIAR